MAGERLNIWIAVRTGIVAGILVAVFLAWVGRLLELDLPPWDWSSLASGWIGTTVELSRSIVWLLPVAVVWSTIIGLACALVFKYVTQVTSAWSGALVGCAVATVTAIVLGLIPWAAFWYSYMYMPARAPLGPYNATWAFAALIAAGAGSGLVVGASYRRSIHARKSAHRWRQIYPARLPSPGRL